MQIPPWLTYLIAALVFAYAIFRIRIYMIPRDKYAEMKDRGPMYRVPRRMHLMMGIIFLIFGTWMVGQALGIFAF